MLQAPQNVKITLEKNTAVIKFTKGEGSKRTEIDKFWVNGEGTYDEYTNNTSFYYDGLEWGKTYNFRLRSFSEQGEVAESDVYSFKIEDAIIPTPATDVRVTVNKNIATVKFKKGKGERTYIDMFWVSGEGTLDDYTTGDGFYLENLPWGLEGKFVLVTISNTGEKIASDVYSFKIEDEIIPVPLKNVKVTTYKNSAEIHFTRGKEVCVRLDKFWVNGEGTWDEYTRTDDVFYLDDLEWGKTYEFKLRSEGNTGLVADTKPISFTIEELIIPTAPTNIKVVKFKNNAEIHFTKGKAAKTMLDLDDDGTFEQYTVNDSVFFLENLEWGKTYNFKLRSMGNTDLYKDSPVMSFSIDKAIGPKLPTTVKTEIELNTVVIRMEGQEGIRTEIAKSWDGGLDNFDEYTTGSTFYYDNLAWGGHYEFRLRSVSNTGAVLTSQKYSFDIVENPKPIAPTNISQIIEGNTVIIRFKKGNGIKTQIDCSWLDGLGSWDEYTTGNDFYFENLPYNAKLQYKLRTVSVGGQTAETELRTFYTPIA